MTSSSRTMSVALLALAVASLGAGSSLLAACGASESGATAVPSGSPRQSATPAPGATPSAHGGVEIAFTRGWLSGDNGILEGGIFIVRADGTGLRCLVPTSDARHPAWSPDGSAIAYFALEGVRVVNADGSGDRVVTPAQAWGGWACWLCWSPDGTQIAFSSYDGGVSDVYVVNADGSGRRRLTHGAPGSSVGHLAWAEDGRILFDMRDEAGGAARLYSVKADGSGLARQRTGGSFDSFSLSPDGAWLLLSEANSLVRVSAPGAPLRRILEVWGTARYAERTSFFALASSWSGDGRRIVFAADQRAFIGPSGLYVTDAKGSHVRRIANAGLGWDPVWRPQ